MRDLIPTIVEGLCGLTAAGLLALWHLRRARVGLARGQLSVRAAVRFSAARWRRGTLVVTPARVTWQRRYRTGPPVDLTPLRIHGRRAATFREYLVSVPEGHVVFVCSAAGRAVEVAMPEAYEAAFTRLVAAG